MKRPFGAVFLFPTRKNQRFSSQDAKEDLCAPLVCSRADSAEPEDEESLDGVLTGCGPLCRGPETALNCEPRTITAITSSRLMIEVPRP